MFRFTIFDIMGSLQWKLGNFEEAVWKQFWVMRWLLWIFRDVPRNMSPRAFARRCVRF